jgi:hypothetical protein
MRTRVICGFVAGCSRSYATERRDVVGAWSGTPLYHQVGDRKIDVEVLGDDFAVDEVVQLGARQL